MPDTIEDRLARLGTSLEDAAGIGSPAGVRGRGEQLRVAHRRRMVAMTASTAVIAIVGVGGALALGGGSGQQDPVRPGQASRSALAPRTTAPVTGRLTAPPGPATSKAPSGAPSTGQAAPTGEAPPTASAKAAVVISLKQHEMTVSEDGKTLRTIPITAGIPGHETPVGSFSVTAKQDQFFLQSSEVGLNPPAGTYEVASAWGIVLSGGTTPTLYAAPWALAKLGKVDSTHGGVAMSPDDARWLYTVLVVGDRVEIR
ncbi:MAG: L,D-transpeptidase family protein [Catenulispora sp.]|nr:L,D-transpeptidase family protein [Catenulispora sp.]